jgi:hypothetical protein
MSECQREVIPEDIPCSIISSWKPSSCNQTMNIYLKNGSFIQSLEWGDSGAFCNATFNISTIGTYVYDNSTIESGIVNVIPEKEVDKMIAIIFGLSLIIIYFVAVGLLNKGFGLKFLAFGFSLIELIYMVGILYVNEASGSLISLLKMNFYIMAIVGFGIGILSLFLHSVRIATPEADMDDTLSSRKWDGQGKWG